MSISIKITAEEVILKSVKGTAEISLAVTFFDKVTAYHSQLWIHNINLGIVAPNIYLIT